MAPGGGLKSSSPYGEDIKRIIRDMLTEELSLRARDNGNGTVMVWMTLREKVVGKGLLLRSNMTKEVLP